MRKRKQKKSERFRKIEEKIYELAIIINQYGQKAYHLNKRANRPKYLRTHKGKQWRAEARRLYRKADETADKIEQLHDMLDEEM